MTLQTVAVKNKFYQGRYRFEHYYVYGCACVCQDVQGSDVVFYMLRWMSTQLNIFTTIHKQWMIFLCVKTLRAHIFTLYSTIFTRKSFVGVNISNRYAPWSLLLLAARERYWRNILYFLWSIKKNITWSFNPLLFNVYVYLIF